jgi:large-conductance mechanosensitive channel
MIRKSDNWFKNLPYFMIFISITSTASYCVLIFQYFCVLEFSKEATASTLGTLGDFVGGLFNPILNFFVILLMLQTYKTQKKELEHTIKENEKLRDKEKAEKVLNHISFLCEQTNFILDLVVDAGGAQYTSRRILGYAEASSNVKSGAKGNFGIIASLLRRLNDDLIELKSLDNSSALPDSYYTIFREIARKLMLLKFMKENDWKIIED